MAHLSFRIGAESEMVAMATMAPGALEVVGGGGSGASGEWLGRQAVNSFW